MITDLFVPVGMGIAFIGLIISNRMTENSIRELDDAVRDDARNRRSIVQDKNVRFVLVSGFVAFLLSFSFSDYLSDILSLLLVLWLLRGWRDFACTNLLFRNLPPTFVAKRRKAALIGIVLVSIGLFPMLLSCISRLHVFRLLDK